MHNTWCFFTVCMSPTLTGSTVLQCFETKYMTVRFLSVTATYVLCLISQVSYIHVRYTHFLHSFLENPFLPVCATCTNPCGGTTICGTLGGCNMDSSSRVLGWRWSRHSHSGELNSPKRWSQIRCVRKPALIVTVSMLVSCLHLYWESIFTAHVLVSP